MKIAIDISCLLNTTFISGIQRVVIETTLGLLANGHDVKLLKYRHDTDKFYLVDNDDFIYKYKEKIEHQPTISNESYEEFDAELVFLDVDSTWSLDNKKRSVLFPWLKARGVKIVSYIYDVIPLNFPEYADQKLMYDFSIYITAILKYADIVLTETESGVKSIKKLCSAIGVEEPIFHSTWLGADSITISNTNNLDDNVLSVLSKKYILMVGTIEPRKNHKLVLDAFDKKLFDEGYELVFAGREGWNIADFLDRMSKHSLLGSRFHYFKGLDDANIHALYDNAYLLAFPSYAEGFGLPIIEAFQHKLPVIGADIDVTMEVAGDMGIFYKQDDVDDFILKVLNLSAETYQIMKENLNKFEIPTWKEMVNRIESAIKDL